MDVICLRKTYFIKSIPSKGAVRPKHSDYKLLEPLRNFKFDINEFEQKIDSLGLKCSGGSMQIQSSGIRKGETIEAGSVLDGGSPNKSGMILKYLY